MATYDRLQGCATLQEAGGLSQCGDWMSTFWSTDHNTGQIEEPGPAAVAPGTPWDAADEAACPLCGILAIYQ